MKQSSKIIFSALLGLSFLFSFARAHAATIFMVPQSAKAGVGDTVTIGVKIDGEGAAFNGAQATIRFPKETLQVSSLNKSGSAFSFWLEDPNFSNTDGVISFIGGTPYGVSGNSVNILEITFTTKGSGNAELSFGDAAITASDGSGTNILSKISGAVIAVSPTRVAPQIQQITRTPAPAQGLPVKPNINIPLYAEENQWYSTESPFNVSWDLPLDISGISTALNKQPNFSPAQNSEGLFDNKPYDALKDGIWYLHVRFKNDVGWGPAVHRKIAIDTQPPLGFALTSLDGEETDNPSPTLQFKTSDAISGLKEYTVKIGEGEPINIPATDTTDGYQLSVQAPGHYRVVVRAADQAGNGVENSINLNILPIASPVITFVTKQMFSDDAGGLTIKGTSLPKTEVDLSLDLSGAVIDKGATNTDGNGNWEFVFGKPLKNGSYTIKAQNKDSRGALSAEVESSGISVKTRPIIQLGSFQLGTGGAASFLLLVIAGGFAGGFWFFKKRQEKIWLRTTAVQNDLEKIFNMMKDGLKNIEQSHGTPTDADDQFAIKKMQENMAKMETYLKKGIQKIKDQ